MGCVISQTPAPGVRIVQTPRPKSKLTSPSKSEQDLSKKGSLNNTQLDTDSGGPSKPNNRSLKQTLVLRYDNIPHLRRNSAGERNFILRRSSSATGSKENHCDDLQFKRNLNASATENGGDFQLSRRKTSENSIHYSNNRSGRSSKDHNSFSNTNDFGVKRTMTPSFSVRPSLFYFEKQNSLRDMRSRTLGPRKMSDKDEKVEDFNVMDQCNSESGSRNNIDSLQKLLVVKQTPSDPNLITPDSKTGSKISTTAGSALTLEHVLSQQQTPIKSSTTSYFQFSEMVQAQNCETEREKDERTGREVSEKANSRRKASSSLSERMDPNQAEVQQQAHAKYIEPLVINIVDSQTRHKTNRAQTWVNTPVRALPFGNHDQNLALDGGNSSPGKPVARENLSSEVQSPIKRKHPTAFFGHSPKLSASDKFKCNLLDFVKNEDDDISPIISSQKQSNSKLDKLPLPQQSTWSDKLELSKIDSNQRLEISKIDSNQKLELSKISSNQTAQRKSSGDLTELHSIFPKAFPSDCKDGESELKKSNLLLKESSPPKRKGHPKFSKNLLALARAEDAEQEKNSTMLSLSKIEKGQGQDNSAMHTTGMSPIQENNFRSNFSNYDPAQTAIGKYTSQQYSNANNGNVKIISQPNITANGLNDTHNPSIHNFESNVSAMNISNFVFYYENEDVEYEEVKGGPNRTPKMSQDQKILSALYNSPSNRNQGFYPLQRKKTWDGGWPGQFGNVMMGSPALNRKDSMQSSGNCTPVNAKKESFTSLCFNNFQPESPQQNWRGENAQGPSEEGIGSPQNQEQLPKLNKHKSLRKSIFLQESNAVSSDDLNSQGEDPKKQTATRPAASKNLEKSKSCTGFVCPQIDNPSNPKTEDAQNELKSNLNDSRDPLSMPTSPNNRSFVFQRKNSMTPVSPNLRGVVLKRMQSSVVETSKLDKTIDEDGQKKINQYLMIKDIGKGGFGKVKLAQDTNTKAYFAIKIANKAKMKRNFFSKTKDALTALEREIAVMKKLDHPNIVKLWEVIDDPKEEKLYLVMDLVKKGAVMSKSYWRHENKEALDKSGLSVSGFDNSFFSELPNGKKVLTEEKALKYFRELILGLDYLHNHAGVIHRDIKPENLLIDESDCLKISDFGVSLIMEDNSDELKNNAGTKLFLPPESFDGKAYRGKPADIWAAGATLFYFLTGKPPFFATVQSDLMQKVLNEEPVYPDTMSKKVQDVIKGCLKKDPAQRATIEDIMNGGWLTEDGKYILKNIYEDDDEFKLSEQEVGIALTPLEYKAAVKLRAFLKKHIDHKKRRASSIPPDDKNVTAAQRQAMQSRANLLKALQ